MDSLSKMKCFIEKEQILFTSQQRKDWNSIEAYCNPMKKCFLEKKLLVLSKIETNKANNKLIFFIKITN
jgi:hypothetical protein